MKRMDESGRRSIAIGLGVAVIIGAALTGCTRDEGGDMHEDWTVDQAKTETMRMERTIEGAFPEGSILSIDQKQNGVLLACADDEYQWTGGIDLQLTPGQDAVKAAEAVASAFGGQDGFTTEIREGATGPTAVVSGPDGLSFVGGLEGDDLVTVLSSSRCVSLQEGESAFDTF